MLRLLSDNLAEGRQQHQGMDAIDKQGSGGAYQLQPISGLAGILQGSLKGR